MPSWPPGYFALFVAQEPAGSDVVIDGAADRGTGPDASSITS